MRARIRNVKPEILLDEKLWDLEQRIGPLVYRTFQGLWMLADREGRFEWKPRQLKAAILPYWSGDIEPLLRGLVDDGFVQRYQVDGRSYGCVRNFPKHQRPNAREPKSELPPPPGESEPDPARARTCMHVQDSDEAHACECGDTCVHVSSGKGRGIGNWEGEGNARARAASPPPPPDAPEPAPESEPADRPTLRPPRPARGQAPPEADSQTSGAHTQEVVDAWADAYAAAEAGVPPKLTGQRLVAAVEFARSVARAHEVGLRAAAMAIAKATIDLPRDKRQWALSELDPYVAAKADRLREVRTKGFVEPSPPEAWGRPLTVEEQDAQLDAIFGPVPLAKGGAR